jgi:ubiquinone/menaquinone biosynthesis C-methylase UbiE
MHNDLRASGSAEEFDSNWKQRKETLYNHWTKGRPKNQIQLAFRSHWNLFQELIGGAKYSNCLEVGCGRGSISSYFADAGYKCSLLDCSASVLDTAKEILHKNNHQAEFINGDALDLPFDDNSFDVIVSIGLLEHFEDIKTPIHEQHRVLRPGGLFLGYIVPERKDNIQKYFNWLNYVFADIAELFSSIKKNPTAKSEIYRSDFGSERYLSIINQLSVKDVQVMGVYPLPMLSHSPEFPFSLLPKPLEILFTEIFQGILRIRSVLYKKNPWICNEELGQAFLLAFKKAG